MLTAARSGEVRLATWDEINTTDQVWTVPATRMKANWEHWVPLCGRTIEILETARTLGDGRGPLVLPTPRGKPLDAQRLVHLLQMHQISAVPHGFRSSFRDWAAGETNHLREVIEAALAHVVQNKVEAAYARSDLFERRRHLMDDWATYLEVEPVAGGIPLADRAAPAKVDAAVRLSRPGPVEKQQPMTTAS